MEFLFQIAILIMSVVIHEVSHGYAALYLGDQTAKYEGRLTLNPIKHLELFGSFLLPVMSYMLGGFLIGWAKPVPYNPFNLRPGRFSEAIVAGAGPLSNFSLAIFFGLLIRFGLADMVGLRFAEISQLIVLINIVLGVFNLVPIPPLDGSKLLFAFFPDRLLELRNFFERYGIVLLLLFIFFLSSALLPIVAFIFSLITGIYF